MDTSKLKGIQDWPIPSTVKQVREFLGFGNFYRQFIRNFSDIAQPLNKLLKKDRNFDWTLECQSSFDEMKKQSMEEPVLAMPDHSRPFQIETDALKYATGAVLVQLDSNGDRHPVVFYSKTFSPAEQNYNIHDRELLAIIWVLEAWRHYIQGLGLTTVILSDHQNLTTHKEAKKLNRRQARWFLFLSEYDIKLVHTPGKKMIQSNALSQWPDHCPAEDNNNDDMILLPDNLFIYLIDVDLQERITNIDTMDKDAETSLLLLLNGKLANDWTLEKYGDGNILLIEKRTIFLKTISCKKIFWKIFMITKLLVIQENYGPITLFDNIIGGQAYTLSSRTMFKVAEPVSSLKLTKTPQNPHSYPQKALNWQDLSLIAQWIWLLTYHLPTALILSWSW